jgi:hypothetical protein
MKTLLLAPSDHPYFGGEWPKSFGQLLVSTRTRDHCPGSRSNEKISFVPQVPVSDLAELTGLAWVIPRFQKSFF